MKKRILNVLLVVFTMILLSGCGKSESSAKSEPNKELTDMDLYRVDGVIWKENGEEKYSSFHFANYPGNTEYEEESDVFAFRFGYKSRCTVLYEGEEAEQMKQLLVDLYSVEDDALCAWMHEFLYVYIDDKDLKTINEDDDLYKTKHMEFYNRTNCEKLDIVKDREKIIAIAKEFRSVYETYLDEENEEWSSNYLSLPYASDLDGVSFGDWSTHDEYGTLAKYGYGKMYEENRYEIAGDGDMYIIYKGDLSGEYELYRITEELENYSIIEGAFYYD